MGFSLPSAAWVLIVAAILAVHAAILAAARWHHPAAPRTFLTVVAVLIWIGGYAVEISAHRFDTMVFWANVQFIGIGATPLLWLMTTRRLVGRPPLPRVVVAVIALIPLATVVLAFSNPVHGLFRLNPGVVRAGGMVLLRADYGAWHNFIFVPYQYALYFAALAVIIAAWRKGSPALRGRYAALVAAMLLPMVGGALYVVGIPPFENFNPTPVLLLLSLVLFLWIVSRHRVLDIVPIARERIMDTLSEAVIVLDVAGTIAYLNSAARSFFAELHEGVRGASFAEVMADYPALQVLSHGLETDEIGFEMPSQAGPRYFQAQSTVVVGLDAVPIGRTISVTDISAQVALLQSAATADSPVSMLRSPRRCIDHGRYELRRAKSLGRPFHVVVLDGGPDGEPGPELERALDAALGEFDCGAYLGVGRYLFVLPETDGVVVRERMKALREIFAGFVEAPTVGSAGVEGGETGGIEHLISEALRTRR